MGVVVFGAFELLLEAGNVIIINRLELVLFLLQPQFLPVFDEFLGCFKG